MAAVNSIYDKAKELFLGGDLDWTTDDIRIILIDANDIALAVTGATNATPIVITTATHGLTTGDRVNISGVGGNTAANGAWVVTVLSGTTFSLATSVGNGAYTSGGFMFDLSNDQFLSDISAGGRVATSGALASKTLTRGVADAADVTLTAVTGDQFEAIIGYKHTGVESTSPLIWLDVTATNLPSTPNGGNIIVQFDSGANKIFSL